MRLRLEVIPIIMLAMHIHQVSLVTMHKYTRVQSNYDCCDVHLRSQVLHLNSGPDDVRHWLRRLAPSWMRIQVEERVECIVKSMHIHIPEECPQS